MSILLANSLKELLTETAFKLKGAARRKFMAQTVIELEFGGRLYAKELMQTSKVLQNKAFSHSCFDFFWFSTDANYQNCSPTSNSKCNPRSN